MILDEKFNCLVIILNGKIYNLTLKPYVFEMKGPQVKISWAMEQWKFVVSASSVWGCRGHKAGYGRDGM